MAKPLINISGKQAFLFVCFLVGYEFLTYIANDMIMPGMIDVVHSFHAPESSVATSLTAYILGGASLQLILGPVSDAYGRRPMMLLGAALFFLFTVLIALTGSMQQFLVARFLQGTGLCFIGVIGYATIQEIFAEMDAVRIVAAMTNASILAPLLGPLLGAVVIHYTSWRLIFAVVAVCALAVLWGLWRYMPESVVKSEKNTKKSFSASQIAGNYRALLSNARYVYCALALGLIGAPCIVWIALSPIIMISEAKLTVMQYALWQLPVFGATILGNWYLHRLTYRYELKPIIILGSTIITISLLLMVLLPYFYGNHYSYLLPGTILYFFSLSIVSAPLNRFCLFVTEVSKGTASALLSLTIMLIYAIGIEGANWCYQTHSNLYFGLYCLMLGALYLLCIGLVFMPAYVLDESL